MDYFFYNTDADSLSEQPKPRFRVLIDESFAAVGGDRQKFGEQLGKLVPGDVLLMYENKVGVVAVGKVLQPWDGISQAIPRYYSLTEMSGFAADSHEYRIAVDWFLDLSSSPITLAQLQDQVGYLPRGAVTRISKKQTEIVRLIEERHSVLPLLPEEVNQPSLYIEGATRQVSINTYERDRSAVLACKAHWGTACVICGFDFGAVYGSEFAGYIHVHHRRPLSEIGGEYVINPVTDLCPICPNCHAAIHHGGRLRTEEELQQLINSAKTCSRP